MPYKIEKRGDEYCVVKVDTGKSMGCHDTRAEAAAQVRALYANEHKELPEPVSVWMGFRFPTTPLLTLLTNRLKTILVEKDIQWEKSHEWRMTLMRVHGQTIDASVRLCEMDHGRGLAVDKIALDQLVVRNGNLFITASKSQPILDVQMEVVQSALSVGVMPQAQSVVNHPDILLAYDVPDDTMDRLKDFQGMKSSLYPVELELDINDRTVMVWDLDPEDTVGRKSAPLQKSFVFRDAEGARYMLLVTSNSYQDREGQTIETKALEEYVTSQWQGDTFRGDNVHLFWHDGPAIGEIVWADMVGPFLVEVSKERRSGLGLIAEYTKAIWDHIEITDTPYGTSHGFEYREGDLLDDGAGGTFKAIRKFETSSLPLEYAANWLTFSGVIPMEPKREEVLNEIAGRSLADRIKTALHLTEEELTERGVEHKAIAEQVTKADLADVLVAMYKRIDEAVKTATKEAGDGVEVEIDLHDVAATTLDDFMAVPSTTVAEVADLLAVPEAGPEDEDEDQEPVEETEDGLGAAATPVEIEALRSLAALNDALMQDREDALAQNKTLIEQNAELIAQIKGVVALRETVDGLAKVVSGLEKQLAQRPRASIAQETNLDGLADAMVKTIEGATGKSGVPEGFWGRAKS